MKKIFLLTFFLLTFSISFSQQVPDDSYDPEIKSPAYDTGKGPVVFLDEAHNNFHTIDYRYRPFAKLLEKDGYEIKPSKSKITRDLLDQCSIFVISDPMSKENKSAYTRDEIVVLRDWVSGGGSLLLITDHMPDAPAIADLAAAFGIEPLNGYVLNSAPGEDVGPVHFKRNDGTLTEHPVTINVNRTNTIQTLFKSFLCLLERLVFIENIEKSLNIKLFQETDVPKGNSGNQDRKRHINGRLRVVTVQCDFKNLFPGIEYQFSENQQISPSFQYEIAKIFLFKLLPSGVKIPLLCKFHHRVHSG